MMRSKQLQWRQVFEVEHAVREDYILVLQVALSTQTFNKTSVARYPCGIAKVVADEAVDGSVWSYRHDNNGLLGKGARNKLVVGSQMTYCARARQVLEERINSPMTGMRLDSMYPLKQKSFLVIKSCVCPRRQ